MPTNWTEATQGATAFTEASGSATGWIEPDDTASMFTASHPMIGAGLVTILLDLPIVQLSHQGNMNDSWTEAAL